MFWYQKILDCMELLKNMSETLQNDADHADQQNNSMTAPDTQNSKARSNESSEQPISGRRGRPRKPRAERQTIQLGARITDRMDDWLREIAKYEGSLETTEIVRYALLDLVRRYRQDPFFNTFLEKQAASGDHRAQRLLGEETEG